MRFVTPGALRRVPVLLALSGLASLSWARHRAWLDRADSLQLDFEECVVVADQHWDCYTCRAAQAWFGDPCSLDWMIAFSTQVDAGGALCHALALARIDDNRPGCIGAAIGRSHDPAVRRAAADLLDGGRVEVADWYARATIRPMPNARR